MFETKNFRNHKIGYDIVNIFFHSSQVGWSVALHISKKNIFFSNEDT